MKLGEGNIKLLNADLPLEIKGTLKNLNIDRWISTLSDFPKNETPEKVLASTLGLAGKYQGQRT